MRMHPKKRGIRALGIAESFRNKDRRSVLAGVVMRSDLVIDGFTFGGATVGGDDATSSVLRMHRNLRRSDVNLILLSGCIISLYNIVDLDALAEKSGVPVVCLTWRESGGIEDSIRRHFTDAEEKVARYRRLGERERFVLHTGHTVYARLAALSADDALALLNSFTREGGIPEPVRLAKLLSHASRAHPHPAN
jgi:endonuclease V-like protein UPF0215 family